MIRKSTNGAGDRFFTIYAPEDMAPGGLEITVRATDAGLDFAGEMVPWDEVLPPRRSSVQESAPATAADGLTETAIDLTTYEGDPAAILALPGAVPPDEAPANRLVVVVVDRRGEEEEHNEYQLSMQDSARYDVTLGHRSEASDDWETVGWNWWQDHFGSGGRRVVAAFPDAGLAEIDNPALLGRLSAARAVAPAGVPEGVIVPAEANTAIRARAESRAIDFGLDFDQFGGDEAIDALYRAMVSGGKPASPTPTPTAQGMGWQEDAALEHVDYPGGRFGPKMLDINDEVSEREAELIAKSHGYELLFRTEEVPNELAGSDDFAAQLAAVEPLFSLDGGWTLVGAHDNEDGEIVLSYVRRLPSAPSAGEARS